MFLVGENSNSFGLLICFDYNAAEMEDLILKKEIKNVKLLVISAEDTFQNKPLVAVTVQDED